MSELKMFYGPPLNLSRLIDIVWKLTTKRIVTPRFKTTAAHLERVCENNSESNVNYVMVRRLKTSVLEPWADNDSCMDLFSLVTPVRACNPILRLLQRLATNAWTLQASRCRNSLSPLYVTAIETGPSC